jgi:hypothetical protein
MINHKAMSLPDRMTLIRNSGVYVQSLSSLVDNLVGPTLQMLVDREQYNQSMVCFALCFDLFRGIFFTFEWRV